MRFLSAVLVGGLLLGIVLGSGLTATSFASVSQSSSIGTDASGPLRLLTVLKSGAGSGGVVGYGVTCGTDCSQYFNNGTVVRLTATANAGSKFNGWTGCSYSFNSVITVTMISNKTCVAKFKKS